MLKKFNKIFLYIIVSIIFIGCYLVTRKKIIEREIIYTSNTASEVYMVWGTIEGQLPPHNLWPPGSYLKAAMVYSKMSFSNGKFSITQKLPYGSNLYYWMVQTKDKNGNTTDIWDTGGDNKQFYNVVFSYDGLFNPGYFIFLAGFIPLVLLYWRNRNNKLQITKPPQFRIKQYIPQFDSIRAIAVLLVIVHHWFEGNRVLNFLPNGSLGVNIFFVLSGFLITGILLKAKKQSEEQGLKKSTLFSNFYIRRTLRIFPIYYLLLIIFWIINDPAIKEDGIYYFTYTSNYLFYAEQFFPARLSHLWSLAVEEQFYIFWPWLIVLVNKKYLPYLISLFIIIGLSANYIFISKGWWVQIFTPACFDAFAIGAMLSWVIAYRPEVIEQVQPKFKWICLIILLLFIASVFDYSFLPNRTVHALLAIAIIYYCLFKNSNRLMNTILNNKWLMYIGKISYGVYLYHLFIPELWGWIINKFASWNIDLLYNKAMPGAIKPAWLFMQHFSFLMLICILSWKLIEKPVNNLKGRFENKIPAPNKITAVA